MDIFIVGEKRSYVEKSYRKSLHIQGNYDNITTIGDINLFGFGGSVKIKNLVCSRFSILNMKHILVNNLKCFSFSAMSDIKFVYNLHITYTGVSRIDLSLLPNLSKLTCDGHLIILKTGYNRLMSITAKSIIFRKGCSVLKSLKYFNITTFIFDKDNVTHMIKNTKRYVYETNSYESKSDITDVSTEIIEGLKVGLIVTSGKDVCHLYRTGYIKNMDIKYNVFENVLNLTFDYYLQMF